jgi:2-methylaconitate cis-trans-isomerase PrpF
MMTIITKAPFKINKVKSGYSYIIVCVFNESSLFARLLTDDLQMMSFLIRSIKPHINQSYNKIAFICENESLDAEINCLFIQYVPDKNEFEMSGNCGNALLGGTITEICLNKKPLNRTYIVKNLNSNKYTKIRVLQQREEHVTAEIIFENPEGSLTNTLLPTGRSVQQIEVNGKTLDISIVDAANPYVYVDRKQLGLTERQYFSQSLKITEEMRNIRREAQNIIGIQEDSVFPKFAMINASSLNNQIGARMITVPHWHKSFALTGMVNLVVASQVEGTLIQKNTNFVQNNNLYISCIDGRAYTTTFYKEDHYTVSILQNVNLKGV